MLSAHGWLSLTVLSLVRWVPWKKAGNGDCGTILPVTERGERERERDAKRRKRKGADRRRFYISATDSARGPF